MLISGRDEFKDKLIESFAASGYAWVNWYLGTLSCKSLVDLRNIAATTHDFQVQVHNYANCPTLSVSNTNVIIGEVTLASHNCFEIL